MMANRSVTLVRKLQSDIRPGEVEESRIGWLEVVHWGKRGRKGSHGSFRGVSSGTYAASGEQHGGIRQGVRENSGKNME